MKPLLKSNRCFLYVFILLGFLLIWMGLDVAYVRVGKNTAYYEKAEVALYLKEFGELPINYLTKSQANLAFDSYMGAVQNDYNIGGDVFRYEGTIVSLTDAVDLRECDLYPNRQKTMSESNRGPDRLVFSADGNEVFHTSDHYATFVRVTWIGIQWRFMVFVVLFVAYSGGVVWLFVVFHKRNVLTLTELKADGKDILSRLRAMVLFPVRFVRAVVPMFSRQP